MEFLCYKKCSTCKKAENFLKDNNIKYNYREITTQNPTVKELDEWIKRSGTDIKSFFNTSGIIYKELGLKDKLPTMNYEEKLEVLASNGKLVKRPLLVANEFVLIGFKEDIWKNKLK